MLRINEWRLLKTFAARLLTSFMLVGLLPLAAAAEHFGAVEYKPLAVVKGGKYPVDVTASAAGTFYVVDGMARNIIVYGNGYTQNAKFSTVGHPTAIAVYGDSIYVGDAFTKSVKILSGTGTLLGDLQMGGTTANFRLISNIAVDSSGAVYVVDKFSNTIEVFDAAGNYSYTITGFTMPLDAVVVGDELFVIDYPYQADSLDSTASTQQASADVQLSRIQIFDLVTQTFVVDENRVFPGNGWDTTLGQYIHLKSIAADSQNHLYLVDSYQNILYKFDTNGQFLGTIDEAVSIPLGATVSPDGRLMVTSSRDAKVRVLGVDYLAGLPTWLNGAPFADAGADQMVEEEAVFVLDASGSQDEDGISNYTWTQVDGTPVLPSNPFETDSPLLSLTAPATDYHGTILTFELTVADSRHNPNI
jgi:WD40 repeat protein